MTARSAWNGGASSPAGPGPPEAPATGPVGPPKPLSPEELKTNSTMPDVFTFKPVGGPGGKGEYGYVRIWTFDVADPDRFVTEFVRIMTLLPQNGLIIDVRGNG